MKIKKKDLIFIHKFIWSHIYKEVEYIRDINMSNSTIVFNIRKMKNKHISVLLDDKIITNNLDNYLSYHHGCILCLIFRHSENDCFGCPLKDCSSPYSLYQEARKGSLNAIRDIYYSIDKAHIPDSIEIPEE